MLWYDDDDDDEYLLLFIYCKEIFNWVKGNSFLELTSAV